MAARFLHCSLPVLWARKRSRTESRRSSPPPSCFLSQDEEDCILGLLMLSRSPLVLHGGVRPLPALMQQQVLLPRSSAPPTTRKEEPYPISFPGMTPLLPPPLPEQERSLLLFPALKQQRKNEPLLPLPPPEKHPSPPEQKQQDQQILPPPPLEQERSLLLSPAPKQQPKNEPILPLPPPEQHPLPPASKKQDQQLLPPQPPPTPSTDHLLRYKCSECGKAFSSFQALGGHKSSHYRKRPSPSPQPENQRHVKARRTLTMPSTTMPECSPKKILGIDLNQPLMEID